MNRYRHRYRHRHTTTHVEARIGIVYPPGTARRSGKPGGGAGLALAPPIGVTPSLEVVLPFGRALAPCGAEGWEMGRIYHNFVVLVRVD